MNDNTLSINHFSRFKTNLEGRDLSYMETAVVLLLGLLRLSRADGELVRVEVEKLEHFGLFREVLN